MTALITSSKTLLLSYDNNHLKNLIKISHKKISKQETKQQQKRRLINQIASFRKQWGSHELYAVVITKSVYFLLIQPFCDLPKGIM